MTEQEPAWLTKARSYLGFHELAGNRGIQEFIDGAHTGQEGDPWCAIFVNNALESVGIHGTRSPAANSFTQSPLFVRQQSPQLGTICTFTRTGGNHVAFYTGVDKQGRLLVLGGNQSDQVCIEPHSTDTLTGYWWPKNDLTVAPPVVIGSARSVTPLDQKTIDAIAAAAASSDLARYSWGGRGHAPLGYIQGVAVAYAQALKRLAVRDSVSQAMVRVVDGPGDVFDHYEAILTAAGMVTAGASDVDRLRALFVILTGLGMRESSGGMDIGRDKSAPNTSDDTAEAGTWQQSWNSHSASPELPKLLTAYAGTAPDAVDVIFKHGVTPNAGALENFGDPNSDGYKFQELAKARPSIAALFCAIGMRTLYTHWGPLIRREAEVAPAADALFRQVQAIVPLDGEVLPAIALNDDLLNLVFVLSQEGDTMDANLQAQIIAEIRKANPANRSLLLQALGGTQGPVPTPVVSVHPSPGLGGFDFSQVGTLLTNPTIKKVLGGQPVTLADVLPLIPAVLAMMQGHPVPALPPPTDQPSTPVPPVAPAPVPTSNGSTVATSLSVGLGGAAASLMATAAGLLGPLTGPNASMWSTLLPLASLAAGAIFPAAKPAIGVVSGMLSTYAAGKAKTKA